MRYALTRSLVASMAAFAALHSAQLSYAATQCSCATNNQCPTCNAPYANSASVAPVAPHVAPAPPVANGAIVYNPWYPGNVIPYFSAYPFINAPYLVFDKPVPPPFPAPPPAPQVAPAPPVAPPDQPFAIAGTVPVSPDTRTNPSNPQANSQTNSSCRCNG